MMDNAKTYLNTLFFLFSLLPAAYSQPADTTVEAKIWEGIGGKQNWQDVRYFMFSCLERAGDTSQGVREYLWDKQTGDCRFEEVSKDGDTVITLFNLKTEKGAAFINSEKQGDSLKSAKLIQEALSTFRKDASLLFLPTTMEGRNAIHAVEKEKLIGSRRFTVIKLANEKTSFDASVNGQLYIDARNGRIQHWQPNRADQRDTAYYTVSEFKDVGGGLVLPTHFTASDSSSTVSYPLAAALIHIESHKLNKP